MTAENPQSSLPTIPRLLKKLRKLWKRRSPTMFGVRSCPEGSLKACFGYNQYGAFCIPLSSYHRPAAQKILYGDIHEPLTIDFIMRHMDSGDVIHAGAFFGDFLPALSRACKAGAKIWGFEPNPESHRCAEITLALNGVTNVRLVNAGLGNIGGGVETLFKVKKGDGEALGGGSYFVPDTAVDEDGVIPTKIVKIDEIYPTDRDVSVLHLDVEGFEQEALSGGLATIQRCKPVIILENLPTDAFLESSLHRIGYCVVGRVHGNTIFKVT